MVKGTGAQRSNRLMYHTSFYVDMKILEGLQVCEKAKEQTKFKRSLDENIGVVKMEKNNFGYDPKVKRYFDDFIRGYGRDYRYDMTYICTRL